jgi:hypothetical protein
MISVRICHNLERLYFGIDVFNDNPISGKPFVICFFPFSHYGWFLLAFLGIRQFGCNFCGPWQPLSASIGMEGLTVVPLVSLYTLKSCWLPLPSNIQYLSSVPLNYYLRLSHNKANHTLTDVIF